MATDNTHRFTGRAEGYDLYRQRYPTAEILARLQTWCGLTPGWLVADIGAGTGMLAEVFLENRNRVLAIEPNAEMRDQMQVNFGSLGKCWPQPEILNATAEATSLPDASIDLVAAGRAFHWFDKDRALAEFRRILKPQGWVTLVAINDRAIEGTNAAFRDQIEAYEHLLAAHGTDYTRVRSGYRTYDTMDTFFDGEFHQAALPGTRQLDWPAFHGNIMSLSVSPQPGHPNHEAFQRELHIYFKTYAREGVLTTPTTCWITAGRFAQKK